MKESKLGAVLPIDKMPNNCRECQFCRHYNFTTITKQMNRLDCGVLEVFKNIPLEVMTSEDRHPQCPLQPITPIDSNVNEVLEYKINCIDGEIQNIQGNLDSLDDDSFDTTKLEDKLKNLKEEYNFLNIIKQLLQDKDKHIEELLKACIHLNDCLPHPSASDDFVYKSELAILNRSDTNDK